MNRVKKTIRALALMVLVCMLLTTTVFAAENGSVWLNVMESDAEEHTTAVIAADTTVTDGLVEIRYDSASLTYEGVTVNESYVAMYAVNADEAGLVKISWVAPSAYTFEDAAIWLVQVNFSGTEETSTITMTGDLNDAAGSKIEQGANLDTTALKAAMATAESLYKDNYTARSYRAVEIALANAEDVLADPAATQSAVDAAEETLNNAMASLECKIFKDTSKLIRAITKAHCLQADQYTEESYAAVEEALADAKAVLANPKATQRDIDEAAKALNNAMDALEEKTEQPEDPTDSEQPGGSQKPEGGIIDWIGKIIKGFFGWFHKG